MPVQEITDPILREALLQQLDQQFALRIKAQRAIKPEALDIALTQCINAESAVPLEQEKLRKLLAEETKPVKARYIEYQIDLVAKQMKRAAAAGRRRQAYIWKITDWQAENEKCKNDIQHWFDQWAWTLDPRKDSPLATIPFVPFDFQRDTINWLDNLVFVAREDGVVEKSRDQGWTWISTAWSTKHWRYNEYFQSLFGSKNEDAVDSIEEPDTILEKVRFQLRLLPPQLLPKGFDIKKHAGFMKITNPENGSVISGEAPIPNFGRSGRYTVVFFDEHAAWPHNGRPQWTAASASSKSKVSASTPQGTLTKQAELAKSDLPKLTLKWPLHPWKDQRWYDGQTLSMDEQEIAQEIDIDYEASQPGPVYAKLWDKQYHVVTWAQFGALFKVEQKPHHWYSTLYQDVGTSVDHPTATGWYTKPAKRDSMISLEVEGKVYSYDLSDTAILYRTHTIYDEEIGNIWNELCRLMRPGRERDNLKKYLMSHEAESERKTLIKKNNVVPAPRHWTAGKTRGIAEMKNALKLVDEDKPNPWKPWLNGRPTFIILVANNQYDDPQDDFGMARFQAEIAAYHFPKQVIGEPVKAQAPYAFFNDHMDHARIAAADGFVESSPLTHSEQVHAALPVKYQALMTQATTPDGKIAGLTAAQEMSLNYQMARARQSVKPQIQSWDAFGRPEGEDDDET